MSVTTKQHKAATGSIAVSWRFLAISVITVSCAAFTVGRACRLYVLDPRRSQVQPKVQYVPDSNSDLLPQPILSNQKPAPQFVYTSRHFETGVSAVSDNILVRDAVEHRSIQVESDGAATVVATESEHDYSMYEPAGQHLMIDIKNVDGPFLNDEARLAHAMMDLVQLSQLTMLSYHCHGMHPMGVSCVGVLLESHVSFHTWPTEGVILLDLFTCGPKSLLPLLPIIENLFGIHRPSINGVVEETPHMNWSYKPRGFHLNTNTTNYQEADMNQYFLGWAEYELKTVVSRVKTNYHDIEIFDVINPRFKTLNEYQNSLTKDSSYEALHPDLFQPDRVLYVDGVMQSRTFGEAAYFEALVHPVLLAHSNPRRVAIIGGGEGAILREVLKHNTIEKVTMIEMDKELVDICRAHLPFWSDCSFLIDSKGSCFEDPRVQVIFADPVSWFIGKYAKDGPRPENETYDVVIINSLESTFHDSASQSYNEQFVKALSNALADDGTLAAHVGEEGSYQHASYELSGKTGLERIFVDHLATFGFAAVKDFSDASSGFFGIRSFLVAFKDHESKANWYLDEADINLRIHRRGAKTISGYGPSLRYFDASTMMSYQYPSRVVEEIFCRSNPKPELCDHGHAFDPNVQNYPITSFEVKNSSIPMAGRGLFFKERALNGTYVAIDEGVQDLMVPWATTDVILSFLHSKLKEKGYWQTLYSHMYGYGWATDFAGEVAYSVDASIMTFINHGCNYTYNMGMWLPESEMTVQSMPSELENYAVEMAYYNPFIDRNHLIWQHGLDKTLRDIQAGEELLDNYLAYMSEESWESGVKDIRAQCVQQGTGVITRYETTEGEEGANTNTV